MECKDELKEIDIKNITRYDFDDIIRVRDSNFSNILLEEKSYKTYENSLIHDISYKTFMVAKLLRIMFDEIDRLIKTYDGIRYLLFFASGWYNEIYDKIRYFISEKSGIVVVSHIYAKIKIDSYNYLLIEKTLTFHNIMTIIMSVVNKNENNYYHNKVLEKCSYKNKFSTEYLKRLFVYYK